MEDILLNSMNSQLNWLKEVVRCKKDKKWNNPSRTYTIESQSTFFIIIKAITFLKRGVINVSAYLRWLIKDKHDKLLLCLSDMCKFN